MISTTESLFEKHGTDSSHKKKIFDNNTMEKTLEKNTNLEKYCLGAKIEEMIYKNREIIWDDKIVKAGTCRTIDFSNANPMDPEKFLSEM